MKTVSKKSAPKTKSAIIREQLIKGKTSTEIISYLDKKGFQVYYSEISRIRVILQQEEIEARKEAKKASRKEAKANKPQAVATAA